MDNTIGAALVSLLAAGAGDTDAEGGERWPNRVFSAAAGDADADDDKRGPNRVFSAVENALDWTMHARRNAQMIDRVQLTMVLDRPTSLWTSAASLLPGLLGRQ